MSKTNHLLQEMKQQHFAHTSVFWLPNHFALMKRKQTSNLNWLTLWRPYYFSFSDLLAADKQRKMVEILRRSKPHIYIYSLTSVLSLPQLYERPSEHKHKATPPSWLTRKCPLDAWKRHISAVSKVLAAVINPVSTQVNSDRRAPAAVKSSLVEKPSRDNGAKLTFKADYMRVVIFYSSDSRNNGFPVKHVTR